MAIDAISRSSNVYSMTKPTQSVASDTTAKAEAVVKEPNTAETSAGKDFKITDNAAMNMNADGKSDTEALKRAVEEINKQAKFSEAQFGVHDETGRITIKIVEKETKEVIKEIPAEKTLDMIAKAWELAGLLVDEKR